MVNRIAHFTRIETPDKGTVLLFTIRRIHSRSRLQSLRNACRGLRDAWASQINLRIHTCAAVGVIACGLWVRLALMEWLWISFAIGLVLFAELMNTAIEETINLAIGLRPDPLARRVKDISAGFVLVAALLATVIGSLTFIPHVLRW